MAQRPSPAAAEQRVALVRDFVGLLRKGMKTIGMYRHTPEKFPEFLHAAVQSLEAVLRGGAVTLRVTADNFLLGDEPVWALDGGDALPGRFFREGVRLLVLNPGLDERELTQLVLIMLSNAERGGDDMVTQLFDAGFAHVRYAVVQGYSGGDEDEFARRVDLIAQRLIASARGGHLAGAADSLAAQLEASLPDLPPAPRVEDGQVDAGLRRKVQEELQQRDPRRLDSQLAALVLNLVKGGQLKDPARAVACLTQSIDGALERGDLLMVGSLLEGLAAQGRPSPLLAEVRARLAPELAAPPRFKIVADLVAVPGTNLAAVARYLGELGGDALPGLMELLGRLEEGDARSLVLEAAAALARQAPPRLEAALSAAEPRAARDGLAVLQRVGGPPLIKHLEQALRAPAAATRLEALAVAAAVSGPDAYRLASRATHDRDESVRAAAFRTLVPLMPTRAAAELLGLITAEEWDKRPETEKRLIHECLGRTGRPEALKALQEALAQPKKTFFGGRQVDAKLLAVHGLQHMLTPGAAALLQETAAGQHTEPAVAEAARAAALELQRARAAAAAERPAPKGAARPSEELARALGVLQRTLVPGRPGGDQ